MNSDCTEPINIGSPYEGSILKWAELTLDVVDEVLVSLSSSSSSSSIATKSGISNSQDILRNRRRSQFVFKPMPEDDPPRRQADTTKAKQILDWHPAWEVREGLRETVKSMLEDPNVDVDLESAIRGST